MNKEKIVFVIGVISILMSSIISVYAANYLYSSNEVSYDNSVSGIQSDNVQGAMDELYAQATNYENVTNTLNTYFKNNPTSFFDGSALRLGYNATTATNTFVGFYDSTKTHRGSLQYNTNSDGIILDSRTSTNNMGTGKLDLRGKPVMINSVNFENMFSAESKVIEDNVTVAANTSVSKSVSVSKDGYKPIFTTCNVSGATNNGTNQSFMNIYACVLNQGDKTVTVWARNLTNAQAVVKLTAYVFYVKITA